MPKCVCLHEMAQLAELTLFHILADTCYARLLNFKRGGRFVCNNVKQLELSYILLVRRENGTVTLEKSLAVS